MNLSGRAREGEEGENMNVGGNEERIGKRRRVWVWD